MSIKIDSEYLKQLRFVSYVYLGAFLFLGLIGYLFFHHYCPDGASSCEVASSNNIIVFFLYSSLRSVLFTPALLIPWIAGKSFSFPVAILISYVSLILSCLVLYLPCRIVGKKFVAPWMRANFPALLELITTQDTKIIFITRWIPIFQFDLLSIFLGICNFRLKSVLYGTLLGESLGIFLFCLGTSTNSILVCYKNLFIFSLIGLAPFFIYEYFYLPKTTNKKTFLRLLKSFYKELVFELKVQHNVSPLQMNSIKNSTSNSTTILSERPTILLMYGFFSSRKSLVTLERQFYIKGYDVISFNMGGLFNTFFTKSANESAEFLNTKIKEYLKEHNLSKISIVAHSKGGLVSMWWLLKLGGYKYCDKIITLGTPFKGSFFSYIGLVTPPFGLIWKDIWQMKPGSLFLQELHSASVPKNLQIYNIHSDSDNVVPGDRGIFDRKEYKAQIHPVAMDGLTHYEYMYRKEVVTKVDKILKETPDCMEDESLISVEVPAKSSRKAKKLKKIKSKLKSKTKNKVVT